MNCPRIGHLSNHVPPFPSCTLLEPPRRVVRHPSLEVCLKAAKETLRLRAEATELRVVVLTILQQYVSLFPLFLCSHQCYRMCMS
jgi:hypothetical protein